MPKTTFAQRQMLKSLATRSENGREPGDKIQLPGVSITNRTADALERAGLIKDEGHENYRRIMTITEAGRAFLAEH